MLDNIITMTDGYKPSHYRQLPPHTTGIYSYFEARGGRWPTSTFFGLQYFLKRYLAGKVVTAAHIDKAAKFYAKYFGTSTIFNETGWRQILQEHGGKLPVRIRAVPEGTSVWNRNVLMTVENTDPKHPWLSTYLETLLVETWYPTTVCTQSREMKKTWLEFLRKTGTPELVRWKLHDFGFRGSTSPESAALGGAAHLVSFSGSDTPPAIELIQDYYSTEGAEYMPAGTIPASEHSTMAAWGREQEAEAYRNMLTQFHDCPMVAVVSDSWDIMHAISEVWGKTLKAEVFKFPGVVVFRPDSGKPDEVVVGVINRAAEGFGASINAKGYKLLHPKVAVIQGDKIDPTTQRVILEAVEADGWSVDPLTMGSGGGLLQNMNRDTQGFAFKGSAIEITDPGRPSRWIPYGKAPITQPEKRQKMGRFKLALLDGRWQTVDEDAGVVQDQLVTVFENGAVVREHTFEDIRRRAEDGL